MPASSLRSRSFSSSLRLSASAVSRLRCSQASSCCWTKVPMNWRIGGPPGPRSAEPSLVLVCDSKTGSITRIETAATIDCRTSARVVVLLVEVAQHLDDGLAERLLVRAAHRGVLAVDERVVLLAVVRAVGERDLDVLPLEVDDRIEDLAAEVLLEQVPQAVLGPERLAVEREREAAVEEGVFPEQVLDELGVELEVRAEQLLVGRELDEGAVALGGLRDPVVLLQLAPGELDDLGLPVAHGLRPVGGRERVDRLLADAVEADGLLEGLGVVLGAGVDDRHALEDLAERDAAAVVAHAQGAVGELDLDLPAAAHREFVDGVIDRLLEQHVDAVLGVAAVAEAADVHARAQPDVLGRGEGLDAGFGVVVVGHGVGAVEKQRAGGRR